MKLTAEETAPTAAEGMNPDLPAAEGGEVAKEKHLGVGAIVGMVVGGIVLLILLVVGGLFWYVKSEQAREKREAYQHLVETRDKAKGAVVTTLKSIAKFGEDFHALVAKCDKEMDSAVRQLKGSVGLHRGAAHEGRRGRDRLYEPALRRRGRAGRGRGERRRRRGEGEGRGGRRRDERGRRRRRGHHEHGRRRRGHHEHGRRRRRYERRRPGGKAGGEADRSGGKGEGDRREGGRPCEEGGRRGGAGRRRGGEGS